MCVTCSHTCTSSTLASYKLLFNTALLLVHGFLFRPPSPNLIAISNTSAEYQQSASTGGGATTSEWVLTDLADSSQLATPQRLRDKMEKGIHILQATSLAPRGGGMEGRNLEADRRVRVAEDRARELERNLTQQIGQVLVL